MSGNFANILILMAVAVTAVWLFKRINLPPILAYLFCGILAGPELLSLFEHPEEMSFFAEIGIVFLLFSLGLEFSLPKMLAMRHLVFGVGLGQMAITTSAFTLLATWLGFELKTAIVLPASDFLNHRTRVESYRVGNFGNAQKHLQFESTIASI